MIALTGMMMVIPTFLYSSLLHTRKLRRKKNPDNFVNLVLSWVLVCYFPMAIEFQSSMIGAAVLGIMFFGLGFRMEVFGFGICLGWETDSGAVITFFTSLMFIMIYTILRVLHCN